MVRTMQSDGRPARRRTSGGKTLRGEYSSKTLSGTSSDTTPQKTISSMTIARKTTVRRGIPRKTIDGWTLTPGQNGKELESDEELSDPSDLARPSEPEYNGKNDGFSRHDNETQLNTDSTGDGVRDDTLDNDMDGGIDLHPLTTILEIRRHHNGDIGLTITGFVLSELCGASSAYTSAVEDRVKLIEKTLGQKYVFDSICTDKSTLITSEFVKFTAKQVNNAVAYGKQVASVLNLLTFDGDGAEETPLGDGMVRFTHPDIEFRCLEKSFGDSAMASVLKAVHDYNAHQFLRNEENLLQDLNEQRGQFSETLWRSKEDRQKLKDGRHAHAVFPPNVDLAKAIEYSDDFPFEDSAPLGDDEDLSSEEVLPPETTLKRKVETQIVDDTPQSSRAVKLAKTVQQAAPPSELHTLPRALASERQPHPKETTTTKVSNTIRMPSSNDEEINSDLDDDEIIGYIDSTRRARSSSVLASLVSEEDVQHEETHGMQNREHRGRRVHQQVQLQYFDGPNGTKIQIPTNEEMTTWRKPGRGKRYLAEQFRAWLRIHGGRTHGTLDDLERFVEELIDHHTENGDIFPPGYESVHFKAKAKATSRLAQQALTGFAETSGPYDYTPNTQAGDRELQLIHYGANSAFPNGPRDQALQQPTSNTTIMFREGPSAFIDRRDSHQDSARSMESDPRPGFGPFAGSSARSQPGAYTQPLMGSMFHQRPESRLPGTEGERSNVPNESQLVFVQVTPPALAIGHWEDTQQISHGKAYFWQQDVPTLPYTPGRSAVIDMRVQCVDYGFSKESGSSRTRFEMT